ncbi:MAG: Asp-tRNA(Asn)/Glu-tRNA(Gln) amidotransferase subunit GatC [Planctomycetaceae bacterium]|jgi:aspartyl-tRNA(Asn)/glutamyl-tRNA(Gln) amidotransferase subunit C|nr:Asp-tRNA(Asn)/Glu-tRNA(Gln) amidotransferase subunit GatC [Planctomycetaceae bacterium]MDB4786718.1 Asp-tRNA(Asn)/Glu-tRNA(Gln) amidotransferase subunit GatC [Planctomycetaceae bacterium]MDC0274049.1 Asp-tRNA(Asn)/Glu-tRNA(Gln) amidotransferase subunit GatC [Planctomycetaceae bacterium]MDG2388787.1 Asp-tRNA(Asn)/Glu-tRNA(Gln) amidotransferase subunit GatC [Planctomycetaceae bacterium]
MLSEDDIRKVAELARLNLSEQEVSELRPQLSKLIDYVAVLEEVDTDGVEPMVHAIEQTNVFREDIRCAPLPREDALANAPKTDGKYFLVPQIIEH